MKRQELLLQNYRKRLAGAALSRATKSVCCERTAQWRGGAEATLIEWNSSPPRCLPQRHHDAESRSERAYGTNRRLERHQANKEFATKADAANRAKSDFLANMSFLKYARR